MEEIIKELKTFINKDLYQKKIISFEEFKNMNELLVKDKNEHIKS